MKHKSALKHLLSVCLCTALMGLCLFGIAVNAQAAEIVDSGTCGEDLTWILDSDGTLTISGTGMMMEYYGANPSPWRFDDTIINIVIEEGVTSISKAFTYCSNLTAVSIPESMITIDYEAFYGCDNLQYNTFDNAKYLGNEQNPYLYLAESITDDITDCSIYDGTKIIASYAFKDCQDLVTLIVPDSIVYVGYGAFINCSNLNYHTYDNAMYLGNEENPYVILIQSTSKTITECQISSNAKIIYTSAFASCTELPELEIPDTVTQIAYDAFSSCIVLESVSLPENALAIDDEAFYNCEKLPEVTFQENVKMIGYGVFDQCSELEKMLFEGDAPHFDNETFLNLYTNAYYPASNNTWTEDKLQDYGGTITWVPYTSVQFEITGQPTTQKVIAGKTAKFTVSASGDNITYQWQYRTSSSGSWKNVSAASGKTASYSLTAETRHSSYQYRCEVTDSAGNEVYTNTAYLYVLGIKTQPTTQKVKADATTKFNVSATGANKTYQWQYKTSSTGSWKNVSAASGKTANYSMTAQSRHNGYYYRCRVKDSAGNTVYTKTVRLFVLAIKTQPVSKTVVAGKTAKLTVSATGNALKYQWYYRTSSSGSWKAVSAASGKTANYSMTAQSRHNGYQYRCKITDSAGNVIYTNVVKLTVK